MNDADRDQPTDDLAATRDGSGGPPRDRLPVDTFEEPHEPTVRIASTVGMWLIVLSGPALWIGHFFLVYLAAETSCAAEASPGMTFVGTDGTTAFIVVATVTMALLALAGGFVAHSRAGRGDAPSMYRIGALLSWLSVVAIVVVGVPVLALPVCG